MQRVIGATGDYRAGKRYKIVFLSTETPATDKELTVVEGGDREGAKTKLRKARVVTWTGVWRWRCWLWMDFKGSVNRIYRWIGYEMRPRNI